MHIVAKLLFAASLLTAHAAIAQPIPPDSTDQVLEARPGQRTVIGAGAVSTTKRWGGGVRLTGLSGIGALPGVSFGIEVAGLVRRDEYFVELALGRWKPEETHLVTQSPKPLELALDVWTLRAGWASMKTPLRGWLLADVGEVAGAGTMPGVIPRMVMGATPRERRWAAVGAGFGVAWSMSSQARLIGSFEFAVPVVRDRLMLDQGEYEPDPVSARYALGLEVGWR